MKRSQAGTTLIEVLIATTLLALLLGGVLFAMRIGITAYAKTDAKLMENRRVAGAQRILQSELSGLVPVVAPCGGSAGAGAGANFAFFQAQQQNMRLVSGFSLQEGWRGMPQILEFSVIQGEDGAGVRLIVNEVPYGGPIMAGRFCSGISNQQGGLALPQFPPVQAGEKSFILADKLSYCRFTYEWEIPTQSGAPAKPPVWSPTPMNGMWPIAIRVEMAPLTPDPTILQPLTVTAAVHIHVLPTIGYIDGSVKN